MVYEAQTVMKNASREQLMPFDVFCDAIFIYRFWRTTLTDAMFYMEDEPEKDSSAMEGKKEASVTTTVDSEEQSHSAHSSPRKM